MTEKQLKHLRRIASLGGRAVVNKYGREYMSEIGKRGYKTTSKRYRLVPYGVNDFVFVHRETDQVMSKTLNGRVLNLSQ